MNLDELEAKARAATSCGCCARNEPCAETAHGMRCCTCCMGTGREPGNVTLDGDTVLALVTVARAAKALANRGYPDNGMHYCRGCSANSGSGWRHAAHCVYRAHELDVDAARDALAALEAP